MFLVIRLNLLGILLKMLYIKIENFLNKFYNIIIMLSKNFIKDIIFEQKNEMLEIFQSENIIEREAKKEIKNYIDSPNILAILGVRRCGKSIFAWQIFENGRFAYINFDDERLAYVTPFDLNRILEVFYEIYGRDLKCIILDEPQNVDKWELFANRLRRTKRVIITGSNSKLLAGELTTHLTGRYISSTLFPFSFRELLRYHSFNMERIETTKRAEIFRFLDDFIRYGGLPERFKFGNRILREIYSSIITKDVVMRGRIKKEIEMRRVANFLISNFAKEFTFKSLKNFVAVKHLSTLSKWIELMQEAYLITVIERFTFKLKQPVIAPKKVYCIDTGLINSVGFRFSENMGRLMENLVAIELKRRGCEFYYWKDYQQREVDFVVKEGLRIKELIQVCYDIEDFSTRRRELKALVKSSKELRCKNLLVITWDYEGEEEFKDRRIKFVPLWKWLTSL